MSLDKAIAHGKERRKPYRGSKAIDPSCRNHGGCLWCEENRKHKFRDKEGECVRKEVHYFADDDTEFDTEEECLEYERTFKDQIAAVRFFDDDYNELSDLEHIESYGVYMYIVDRGKAELLFNRLGEYISFDSPDFVVSNRDVLMWQDDGWVSIRNRIEELQNVANKITQKVSE